MAYATRPSAVTAALAGAITEVSAQPLAVDDAAGAIAGALLAGGNEAALFAAALAGAIAAPGGCNATSAMLPCVCGAAGLGSCWWLDTLERASEQYLF